MQLIVQKLSCFSDGGSYMEREPYSGEKSFESLCNPSHALQYLGIMNYDKIQCKLENNYGKCR